jgi:hypothetical protein
MSLKFLIQNKTDEDGRCADGVSLLMNKIKGPVTNNICCKMFLVNK